MPKLLLALILSGTTILAAGVVYFIHTGYRPQPIKVMGISPFSSPESIGQTLFQRYWVEAQNVSVFVFATDPGRVSDRRVIEGFSLEARQRGFDIQDVENWFTRTHEDIASALSRIEFFIPSYSKDAFTNVAGSQKRKVILISVDNHLLERLTQNPGHFMLFVLAPYALTDSEKSIHESRCDTSHRRVQVDCSVLSISEKYGRKKPDATQWLAAADRPHTRLHFLYYREPQPR